MPALAQSSWVRVTVVGTSVGVPPQVSSVCMDAVESSIISTSSGCGVPPAMPAVEVAVTFCPPKPRICMKKGLTVVCSVTLIALQPRLPASPAGLYPAGSLHAVPVWHVVPAEVIERHSTAAVV